MKLIKKIIGIILIGICLYVVVKTRFIIRVIGDGRLCDGFGFELTPSGRQYPINSIIIWAITIITGGGGLNLLSGDR